MLLTVAQYSSCTRQVDRKIDAILLASVLRIWDEIHCVRAFISAVLLFLWTQAVVSGSQAVEGVPLLARSWKEVGISLLGDCVG